MASIAIYIEGGGPTGATNAPFRQGMSQFLSPLVQMARRRHMQWKVVACGSRQEAYEAFCDAERTEPDVLNLLLVDSEELPSGGAGTCRPWHHLLEREGDGWTTPEGATEEQCHMMVVCMETWLLGDPEALKRHFGKGFDAAKLPDVRYLETTSKARVATALAQATKATAATEYKKIRDGAKLLGKVDSAQVRQHCTWCERLFSTLEKALA